jgi:hypothetical protein
MTIAAMLQNCLTYKRTFAILGPPSGNKWGDFEDNSSFLKNINVLFQEV